MPSDAKILVVDDHEDTLYALENALAPLGRDIVRATNGDDALKQVLRGGVGLLLLDVRMPGTGGLDVVRYLGRLEQTRHIPVVLLTGFGADQELTAAAYDLGVADLLLKPVEPWALRTKVRHLFDIHQRCLAAEREVRELRALLAAGTPPPPGEPPGPHRPDARVPPQRDPQRDPARDPRHDTARPPRPERTQRTHDTGQRTQDTKQP
ncbi:response regulator [Streptomyces sp. NPDC008150]|uniref:response regulator n=1 Tax=Streptomyces sp. NPDC008150 TaxID=3364816 RepID=UPI0036EBF95C